MPVHVQKQVDVLTMILVFFFFPVVLFLFVCFYTLPHLRCIDDGLGYLDLFFCCHLKWFYCVVCSTCKKKTNISKDSKDACYI